MKKESIKLSIRKAAKSLEQFVDFCDEKCTAVKEKLYETRFCVDYPIGTEFTSPKGKTCKIKEYIFNSDGCFVVVEKGDGKRSKRMSMTEFESKYTLKNNPEDDDPAAAEADTINEESNDSDDDSDES